MDPIGLDAVFDAGRVRRKANNTPGLKLAKAARVARRCPEVMVKITSFGSLKTGAAKGGKSANFKTQLAYIARDGRLALETERGAVVRDKAALRDLIGDWSADFAGERRRKKQRDTLHMVLSMPEGTPEEAVRLAAGRFARKVFKNHEYVFVLHAPSTDPDPKPALQPHVHLVVKMRGIDGRRLNPRKVDLDDWREAFAEAMRCEGVDAEATPRALRGVVRKAQRSVIRHIERGDGRRPPRISKVRAAKVKEAAVDLEATSRGEAAHGRPWEGRIAARQQATRAAWLAAADEIEKREQYEQKGTHARPPYDQLDVTRMRAGQRAAALYQSHLERSGLQPPPGTIARLRDLSGGHVVQHGRRAQVLLPAHAPDRLGRHVAADHLVRRSGAGVAADADGGGRARGVKGARLAACIRDLVGAMPPVETERHQMERELVGRFGRQTERQQNRSPTQSAGELNLRPDPHAER